MRIPHPSTALGYGTRLNRDFDYSWVPPSRVAVTGLNDPACGRATVLLAYRMT